MSTEIPSFVYFVPAQAGQGEQKSMLLRMEKLFTAVRGSQAVSKDDLVAVKLSFSEWGNTACLRPQFVWQVVDSIKAAGGKPFLTDSNTLYRGGRTNAVDHIHTAVKNGFGFEAMGAPVIIADGLKGRTSVRVETGNPYAPAPRIGAEAFHADALVSLTHIHGHIGTGFAATFKNLGMGFGCRAGKQEMHSQKEAPTCDGEKCVKCGTCVEECPVDAVSLNDQGAIFDEAACIRCGECTVLCPEEAIAVRWGDEPGIMQRRMVDYTCAVLKNKENKSIFYTFLLDVCPDCLCTNFNRPAILPDVGILASTDPVALDQASLDLIKEKAGSDLFAEIYPGRDTEICMAYAEEAGLGSRAYELVKV